MAEANPPRNPDQLLSPPKGTRDFTPAESAVRLKVQSVIEGEFVKFGFTPIQTPAFENFGVLSFKFAGGEEILKETYRLTDQGGRDLGLRYDFTVPLCRYVASNPSLPKPFKRYCIGTVWRDGPLKTGRYREFTQCDADTIGSPLPIADAELISLASSVFTKLGLRITIKLNSRKLLGALMEKVGITQTSNQLSALLVLDKLEKVGYGAVESEWVAKGLGKSALDDLRTLFTISKDNAKVLGVLRNNINSPKGNESIDELEAVISYCRAFGVPADVLVIDPTLARGLNYYTSSIYEVALSDGKGIGLTSSLAAGGRYDELIGKFAQEAGKSSPVPIPAVGLSFGLDVIVDALEKSAVALKGVQSPSVYVITINLPVEGAKIAAMLRGEGITCFTDLLSRSLAKNFEASAKAGCTYSIILGPAEMDANKVKLRNMATGTEAILDLAAAIAQIKSTTQ